VKGSSYYRNCKTCGRRIQLRKMPGGQWVAFEGFETLHDCTRKPEYTSRGPATARTGGDPLSGLDFESIQIPGGFSSPATSSGRREAKKPSRQKTARNGRASRGNTRKRVGHWPSRSRASSLGTTPQQSPSSMSSGGYGTTYPPATRTTSPLPGRPAASGSYRPTTPPGNVPTKGNQINKMWEAWKGLLGMLFFLLVIYGACFRH
jgi:hypothetical protein